MAPKNLQKKWKVKPKASKKFREQFPEYIEPIANLLYQRLPATQKAIDEFYNPDYEGDIHDPFLLKDMAKAVKRIFEAKKKKEKVVIFGDYDADGVTGTSVLYDTLINFGIKPDVYIPDRKHEGYSLNLNALKKLKEKKTTLVITVDCGIRDIGEVVKAQKWGMDIILTDHHLPDDKIPEAFAVINPKNKKEKYPFKDLAGVAVAFKLAHAIIKKSPKGIFTKGYEKWLLDLVSLGTIADMVPVLGENRTLVKYGLIVLSKTKNKGIKSLFDTARIPLSPNKIPTTQQVSFQIAPRINAAGRMDHANVSFELLTTKKESRALEIAKNLEKKNSQRQRVTEKAVKEVEKRVDIKDKIIFEGSKDWSVGIVGLAAGKICDRYARPAFIFHEGKTRCRGSIRSIPKFKVVENLEKCKDLLVDFGGHDLAGGFTFLKKNKKKIGKFLKNLGNKALKEEDLAIETQIDTRIRLEDVNWKLYGDLLAMEPFGIGNPTPLFLAEGVNICQCRVVGNGNKHLKFWFKDNNIILEGIAFGKGEQHCNLIELDNPKIDILFELQADEWNGQKKLQLLIRDLRVSP